MCGRIKCARNHPKKYVRLLGEKVVEITVDVRPLRWALRGLKDFEIFGRSVTFQTKSP